MSLIWVLIAFAVGMILCHRMQPAIQTAMGGQVYGGISGGGKKPRP